MFPFCPGSGLQQKCVSVSILVSDVNITNWAYLITHEGQTLMVLEQRWIHEWRGAERVHHNPALFHHQLGYHQLVAWCNLGINVYGHRYEAYSRLDVSNINPVQHPEQQIVTLGKSIDDNDEDSFFSNEESSKDESTERRDPRRIGAVQSGKQKVGQQSIKRARIDEG